MSGDRILRAGSIAIVILLGGIQVGGAFEARTIKVDLRDHSGYSLVGVNEGLSLGDFLSIGDINGDGSSDLVSSICSPVDRSNIEIILGPWNEQAMNVDEAEGFSIRGPSDNDPACVVATGDVNDDEFDDVVIGAPKSDNQSRGSSGSVYVVFGKSDQQDVDLALFDMGLNLTEGYRIDGPREFSLAGQRVDVVDDLSGDGLAEVMVGAPFAGSAYVVFGKTDVAPIDLATFDQGTQGNSGFRIRHRVPNLNLNYQVAAVGDVNADGLEDLAVALMRKNRHAGNVWVIFGKSSPEPVDVHDLGDDEGFKIKGATEHATTGLGLSGVGDMNGDGFGDIAVGAPAVYSVAKARTYVVFGKDTTEPVRLGDLGDGGFVIRGEGDSQQGLAVDGVGDIDGDGLPDVLIGAPHASNNGRRLSGSAYLIFGKRNSKPVRLRRLGRAGMRLDGAYGADAEFPHYGDLLGLALAGAGDIDGDGRADFFLSAPAEGERNLGRIYLISSSGLPAR